MIDLETVHTLQTRGAAALSNLTAPEKEMLDVTLIMLGNGLLKEALRRGATQEEVAVNAYRYGVAMGLMLKTENGELKGR